MGRPDRFPGLLAVESGSSWFPLSTRSAVTLIDPDCIARGAPMSAGGPASLADASVGSQRPSRSELGSTASGPLDRYLPAPSGSQNAKEEDVASALDRLRERGREALANRRVPVTYHRLYVPRLELSGHSEFELAPTALTAKAFRTACGGESVRVPHNVFVVAARVVRQHEHSVRESRAKVPKA
jgi:hypothetical protein